MITTSDVLTNVQAYLTDNSTAARGRALTFLNMVMKRMPSMRDWNFLIKKTTDTITENGISVPDDYARFISITNNDWFIDRDDQCSIEDSIAISNTSNIPYLWYKDGDTIYLIPYATGNVTFRYIQTIPTYTDSTTDTIFPDECMPYLVAATLAQFQLYDADERSAIYLSQAESELRQLKHWDNLNTPQIQYDPRIARVTYHVASISV